MREYKIEKICGIPAVKTVIGGPKGARAITLLFDTGAASTQFHTSTLQSVGYVFHNRHPDASVYGVTGQKEDGYTLTLASLYVLGVRFQNILVASFKLDRLYEDGIDGLLGFDVISKFHLDMNGPENILKIQ
jgi:hypothetical protein